VDRPDRKVYALNPAGQQRVAEWLAEVGWPKPDLAEFHLKLVVAAAERGRGGRQGLGKPKINAGQRSTLAEPGAIVMWNSVPGNRVLAAGIVADPATAGSIGEITALLRDNAFAAVIPLVAPDVLTVTTTDAE
jgi:hypothetical protein